MKYKLTIEAYDGAREMEVSKEVFDFFAHGEASSNTDWVEFTVAEYEDGEVRAAVTISGEYL